MATNTINLITKYSPEILDEIFQKEAVTTILERNLNLLKFINAKTVMIPKYAIDGLGDYSRANGFPTGAVTVEWETSTLRKDRGKEFNVDAMDDEETAGIAFGNVSREFMRTKTVPEVDAYRLSNLYAKATTANKVTSDIYRNEIIKEFNKAIKVFDDNEVGTDELVLFISTEMDLEIKNSAELMKRISQEDYTSEAGITFKVRKYEGIPIVVVPKARFKTAYVFGDNGFTADVGAKDMSYMFVHFNAALPVKKHEKVRVFAPDTNQSADAWKFQYRLYHDIFTPDNKQVGIYASTGTIKDRA